MFRILLLFYCVGGESMKEEKVDQIGYDYIDQPVPQNERRSWWEITFITSGFSLAVSGMFAGAALATEMTLMSVIGTILLGNILLTVIGGAMGAIGATTGVPTSMIAKRAFGRYAAILISLLWAIVLVGWFSVQTGFFGQAINAMLPRDNFLTSTSIASLWGGALMITTAFIGYKAIRMLSNVAIPLLLILSVVGIWTALSYVGGWSELETVTEGSLTVLSATTIVVGTFVTGAVIQPDISRFAKSAKDAWIAMFLGMVVANGFIVFAGAVTALAMGTGDLPAAMVSLGLGIPGLIILIGAQWTSNDSNLYSASISFANVFKIKRAYIVLIVGIVGTILGAIGVADYFTLFLSTIGTIIPPIAGVVVADYYILNKEKYLKRNYTDSNIIWPAFLAWGIGILAGLFLNFGIAAVNSLVVAFLVHLLLSKFANKK